MENALKGAIYAHGMTVDQLASAIGIHRATLRRKLRGTTEFTLGEIKAIRDALHLAPQEILDIFFG